MAKLKIFNKSIKSQQTALLISASMVPLIVIIIIGLSQAKKLLNDKDYLHLEAIGTLKKDAINTHFENAYRDVSSLSFEHGIAQTFDDFEAYFSNAKMNDTGKLFPQDAEFEQIISANNNYFRSFLSTNNFDDVFLISAKTGYLVYAYTDKLNIGNSLLSSGLKETPLASLYSNIIRTKSIQISDFSLVQNTGKVLSYIGAPVVKPTGEIVGVIAMQLNTERISEIMQEDAGLGKTGETYLVGEDLLLRSKSRFDESSSVMKTKIESESARLGLQKNQGKHIIKNYRDKKVLSYYTPVGLPVNFNTTFDWVLITEINQAEAFMAFKGLVIQMIIIAIVMFVLITIVATIFSRYVTKPIFELKNVTTKIANGDLSQSSFVEREDEIGQLAESIKTMRESLRNQLKEMLEGANVLSTSSAQLMTMISELASGSAETATAVSETTATVEEVKQTAEISNQKAEEVSDSAQKMAMVSQEGKDSVVETIHGMNDIKNQMESIAEIVIQLSEKGNTIGDIVANVNDLAEQSNLLAVNASIEAAKAGEHGKGFAVVAQEIKNMAERSKMATVQIRNILSEVQKEISNAVLATEQGTKAIHAGLEKSSESSEVIATLASSVEQTAQSNIQIAASSQQQLVGMDQIASAMENIKEASTQNANSIKQSEESVADLKNLGERLLDMFNKYRLK